MVRKEKNETKKNHRQKKSEKSEKDKSVINPETQKGIAIVILFAVALISILSMLGLAGTGGDFVSELFVVVFGWGRFIFPIVLLILGYVLLYPDKYNIKLANWIGLALFFLSFYAFLDILSGAGMRGGGYLGLIFSYPLQKAMGFLGGLVIILALVLISFILMINLSLQNFVASKNSLSKLWWKIKIFWYKLFSRDRAEIKEEIPEFKEKSLVVEEEAADKIDKEAVKPEQMELIPQKQKSHRQIKLPLDLLEDKKEKPHGGNIELNKEKIAHTLENFGIEVEMGEVQTGPTVTQYTLKPAEGVKLSRILTLNNDLSLALAAHPIRIEAPIPGRSLVGIEVPNKSKAIIGLKEILASPEFKESKANLKMGLGIDVTGKSYVVDLDPMPHLLIAGATGSGKSVCINSLLVNLLYQYGPDDLKIILVDPKRVEFSLYNGLPHLLTPVITEVDKTINALKWVVSEMDRRYDVLSQSNKRDIQAYNAQNSNKAMPYLVIAIDELADLMATAARDVEAAITRLAQMARAVGIHLILATQRPSVDVITGLIKANITSRIAFNVASLTDSRTILDFSGAEKLLGKGDMLYISAELSKPKRLQGALLEEREIERIVKYLTSKAKPEYDQEITEKQVTSTNERGILESEEEELLDEAKEVIFRAGKASASLLQRRLRIGYARAARILDILEEQGFIGPADGAKPREIISRSTEQLGGSAENYD